jgi:hypothetical protein
MKTNHQILPAILVIISILAFHKPASAQQVKDSELKKNVTPISNSLNYINQLKPVSYEYNQGAYQQLNLPSGKYLGFIADDVKQVLPSAVSEQSNWYARGKNNQRAITTLQTDMEKLVPILVGAVQEQQAEINRLKAELQQLKAGK